MGEGVFLAVWFWSILTAAAIGSSKHDGTGGALYGLFFGPLAIPIAFSLDRRPQCDMCGTRLNTKPGLTEPFFPRCPGCKVRLDAKSGKPVPTERAKT